MTETMKAYRITEEDIPTLVKITPYEEHVLKNNLNWVVVVDFRKYVPRFFINPERVVLEEYGDFNYSTPISM